MSLLTILIAGLAGALARSPDYAKPHAWTTSVAAFVHAVQLVQTPGSPSQVTTSSGTTILAVHLPVEFVESESPWQPAPSPVSFLAGTRPTPSGRRWSSGRR